MIELLLLAGLFSAKVEDPPNPRVLEARVKELLDQAYSREEVARWCIANPDSIYIIVIEGVSISVRCASWHEWKAQRGG